MSSIDLKSEELIEANEASEQVTPESAQPEDSGKKKAVVEKKRRHLTNGYEIFDGMSRALADIGRSQRMFDPLYGFNNVVSAHMKAAERMNPLAGMEAAFKQSRQLNRYSDSMINATKLWQKQLEQAQGSHDLLMNSGIATTVKQMQMIQRPFINMRISSQFKQYEALRNSTFALDQVHQLTSATKHLSQLTSVFPDENWMLELRSPIIDLGISSQFKQFEALQRSTIALDRVQQQTSATKLQSQLTSMFPGTNWMHELRSPIIDMGISSQFKQFEALWKSSFALNHIQQLTSATKHLSDLSSMYFNGSTVDTAWKLPATVREFFSLSCILEAGLVSLEKQIEYTEQTLGMGVIGAPRQIQLLLRKLKYQLNMCKTTIERFMRLPISYIAKEDTALPVLAVLWEIPEQMRSMAADLDTIWSLEA